ncbi:Uncharacterised protein [Mycobacteroides abscessus subsp. abscessus]|nr:Uncharacterised protein [Mycobacteroides abscessus subsp. abscessus]
MAARSVVLRAFWVLISATACPANPLRTRCAHTSAQGWLPVPGIRCSSCAAPRPSARCRCASPAPILAASASGSAPAVAVCDRSRV